MFRDFNEIACLGMGGSYSEIAKDRLFKKYDLYLYQRSIPSIKECIEYVDENPNAVGVVPIETSYKGIIRETIAFNLEEIFPCLKSTPLEDCAFMILSVSSNKVGINLKAIEIVIATS